MRSERYSIRPFHYPERYTKYLNHPVAHAERQGLDGIAKLPTVEKAYINPRFKVQEVISGSRPSVEDWWTAVEARDDIQTYLAGYLTSPRARTHPLLVLGHPGSGKSLFTRVLAARISEHGYLPIRVELREMNADASIKAQIEQSLEATLNESISWSDVIRGAENALPVVMLDGFDELLQATGISRSDYLEQVKQFQLAETEQGRAVAVIVTSRTIVASRARIPLGTIVLRIEAFDRTQVELWLETWNDSNRALFKARGVTQLQLADLLHHRELSSQPILLLMLAIYDAEGNALQRVDEHLTRAVLYESLLNRFVRREVEKHYSSQDDTAVDQLVQSELYYLAIVALAMFNRGQHFVREQDLDYDFYALLPSDGSEAPVGFFQRLTFAQEMLGKFFFVHRSETRLGGGTPKSADSSGSTARSYEFLHATFGEYLIARTVVDLLRDLEAHARVASSSAWRSEAVDDSQLYVLFSFRPLCASSQVLQYVEERSRVVFSKDRASSLCTALRGLLVDASSHNPQRGPTGYSPRAGDIPYRVAAYTANICLLHLALGEQLRLGDVRGHQSWWSSSVLLWQSRFDAEDWRSVVKALSVSPSSDGSVVTWSATRTDESVSNSIGSVLTLLRALYESSAEGELDLTSEGLSAAAEGHEDEPWRSALDQFLSELSYFVIPRAISTHLEEASLVLDAATTLLMNTARSLNVRTSGSFERWVAPSDEDAGTWQPVSLGELVSALRFESWRLSPVEREMLYIWCAESRPASGSRESTSYMRQVLLQLEADIDAVSVRTSTDILRHALWSGPRTPDIDYYSRLARLAVRCLWRRPSSDAAQIAERAIARMDLPHAIGVAPRQVLHVALELENCLSFGAEYQPAPERPRSASDSMGHYSTASQLQDLVSTTLSGLLSDIGDFEQLFEMVDMVEACSEDYGLAGTMIGFARRHYMSEWAAYRGIHATLRLRDDALTAIRVLEVAFLVSSYMVVLEDTEGRRGEVLDGSPESVPDALLVRLARDGERWVPDNSTAFGWLMAAKLAVSDFSATRQGWRRLLERICAA